MVERILKFPFSVVRDGVGTTRPAIITTKRTIELKRRVYVSASAGNEELMPEESVMTWVAQQMAVTGRSPDTQQPRIGSDPIYIRVEGAEYLDRRVIDLPGYQLNKVASSDESLEQIKKLLLEALEKDNSVVLLVEDMYLEQSKSSLVKALKDITGDDNYARTYCNTLPAKHVVALNKLDKFLPYATAADVAQRLSEYASDVGVGMVPIMVARMLMRRRLI